MFDLGGRRVGSDGICAGPVANCMSTGAREGSLQSNDVPGCTTLSGVGASLARLGVGVLRDDLGCLPLGM